MRVLYVTNSLGARGGIERVTIVKANALAQIYDADVHIAYTDSGTYPEKTIHPIEKSVNIHDLGVTFWDLPNGMFCMHAAFVSRTIRLRQKLKRLIADIKPDIVVTTGSFERFAVATLALPTRVKAREYHFNADYRKYLSGNKILHGLAQWVDNKLLPRCFDINLVLTRDDMMSNHLPSKRFDFQYNPCTFMVDSSGHFDDRQNVVVAVGRLEPQKNFSALLHIWSRVVNECRDWQLWIVGDGSERDMLVELARSLNIEDSVRFLGYTSDVRSLMRMSKILAVTSKYEGMGVNIIEAMSQGVVPVSFNTPFGPSEIINSTLVGRVVPMDNYEQFANYLIELIDNPQTLKKMSEAALTRAQDFSLEVVMQQVYDRYKKLIERKSHAK